MEWLNEAKEAKDFRNQRQTFYPTIARSHKGTAPLRQPGKKTVLVANQALSQVLILSKTVGP